MHMTRKWIKVSDILAVSSKSGDISFIDKIRILCSVVLQKDYIVYVYSSLNWFRCALNQGSCPIISQTIY